MNISCYYPTIEKVFWALEIPLDPLVSLFTQCIADMLCLETLKHGTSFNNYLNIRVHGADPRLGGSSIGSSSVSNPKYLDRSKGYVYVFKDSCAVLLESLPIEMQIEGNSVRMNAHRRCIVPDDSFKTSFVEIPLRTRLHAVMSGAAIGVGQCMLSLFTPTVNFRFIPEKLHLSRYENIHSISNNELGRQYERFREDEDYGGMAWKTKRAIKTSHIGLRGILKQGFKGDVLQRIKNNPKKCVIGAIRMIALVIIIRSII